MRYDRANLSTCWHIGWCSFFSLLAPLCSRCNYFDITEIGVGHWIVVFLISVSEFNGNITPTTVKWRHTCVRVLVARYSNYFWMFIVEAENTRDGKIVTYALIKRPHHQYSDSWSSCQLNGNGETKNLCMHEHFQRQYSYTVHSYIMHTIKWVFSCSSNSSVAARCLSHRSFVSFLVCRRFLIRFPSLHCWHGVRVYGQVRATCIRLYVHKDIYPNVHNHTWRTLKRKCNEHGRMFKSEININDTNMAE